MSADIDLDFADRNKILQCIKHIPARQTVNGNDRHHVSGVYVTQIPFDPILQCSNLDYKDAEKRGYFKIDFLNNSVYQLIQSSKHYNQMLELTPPWQRLWADPEWTKNIVHIGNYYGLLKLMQPNSIEKMAAFISVIRPGKAHLQNQPWSKVFETVWDGDNKLGYVFKKSHAVSYAVLVSLHMNLLNQNS